MNEQTATPVPLKPEIPSSSTGITPLTASALPPPASGPDALQGLLEVMARLRSPGGCPWDREQTLESLKPYLLEEAFEVLEAIDGPRSHHREELGDLLLQIVFQARIAEEAGDFTFYDVAEAIRSKMVRRHPHVFGNATEDSAEGVRDSWESRKRDERRTARADASVLDGIPAALPALLQAWRMTEKAARVGFDWPDLQGVRDKVQEELGELEEALAQGQPTEIEAELGDVLFSLVNLARHLKLNPEETLRRANLRFKQRFQVMEQALHAQGLRPETLSIEDLEAHWQAAKRTLRLARG